MGWTCSTHGRAGTCIRYFGSKNLKGRDNSQDPATDGTLHQTWEMKNTYKILVGKPEGKSMRRI
jgi:hypothetical protein